MHRRQGTRDAHASQTRAATTHVPRLASAPELLAAAAAPLLEAAIAAKRAAKTAHRSCVAVAAASGTVMQLRGKPRGAATAMHSTA